MNRTQAQQEMLKRKPKGIRYILENEDFIKEMLQQGESVTSIYEGLKATDTPPPITLDGFRKNINKQGWKKKKGKEQQETTTEENKKHSVLSNVDDAKSKPYHDSSVSADDLI